MLEEAASSDVSYSAASSSIVDFAIGNNDDAGCSTHGQGEGEGGLPCIGRGPVDLWTVDECKPILSKAHTTLLNLLESRKDDQNFLKGLVTFCDRVEKYSNHPLVVFIYPVKR